MRAIRYFLALLACGGAGALANFIPGRLYISVVPAHGFPNQPNNAVFEFNPQDGSYRMFAEIPDALNGRISGLCFTPDGSKLYASLYESSTIAAIHPDGSVTAAYTAADGIGFPIGSNNLGFDSRGNFFEVNLTSPRTIKKFPAGGGPGEVFADTSDGISSYGAIAIAPTDELYFAAEAGNGIVRRFDQDGNGAIFDTFSGNVFSLAVDSRHNVFVSQNTLVWRYTNGDPLTRILLTNTLPGSNDQALALSPDESTLYVTSGHRVFSMPVTGGSPTMLGIISPGYQAFPGDGLAVFVPEPSSGCLLALAFSAFCLRFRR